MRSQYQSKRDSVAYSIQEIETRNTSRIRTADFRRRRARKRKKMLRRRRMIFGLCSVGIVCLFLLLAVQVLGAVLGGMKETIGQSVGGKRTMPKVDEMLVQGIPLWQFETHPVWEENFLTPNEFSRPGDPLEQVNSIFVHYTANQNTSAAQNHSYFEHLKDTGERSASAHFIIGYNGEIIQCIPLDEIAYAVKSRNLDSISIECCYQSGDASFSQETYDSLVALLDWLLTVYDLTPEDILRHYDCGGKICPLYYVEHPEEWKQLKKDVANFHH